MDKKIEHVQKEVDAWHVCAMLLYEAIISKSKWAIKKAMEHYEELDEELPYKMK